MKRIFLLPALALLAVAGCGSDSLAPNDAIPPLTTADSAQQAGLVAYAVAEMGPLAVTYQEKSENVYTFPAGGVISGSVQLDFRTGGANGAPAAPEAADYARLTTLGAQGLSITSPLGGVIHVAADVMVGITRGSPDSATALEGSIGTLDAGDYTATFTIGAVTVYDTGYPTGGPVVFDNGYQALDIDFDGTRFADLSLNGLVRWTFDLDTMDLAEVD